MTEQRNDEFPDQPFLNDVRDALWRRPGQASVMIGSGFSRSARKNRPDAPEIPLWPDLADALSKSLSPSRDKPRDALELAQQYKEAFGRARLHQFLIESVRDGDFSPAKPHSRLLELPWRDVFTTNWDTLLERCLPLTERAYTLVTSADHLPIGAPPRIVKLHGSLPGTFPLIVTRDDYETYPKVFAPLVNTVQQAMMETVFLLLGFSGEDPNFRRWLGWVRENLGESAPRIYLAGWLGLSEPRREELMEKKVVPIDLARHPQAENWPEPLRHAKAVEWVLLSLEHGRPYPPEDWPSHIPPSRRSVPADLEPVQPVLVKCPVEEPWEQARGEPHEPEYLERIRKVLCIWRHNRECYPSWLVMPSDAAHEMGAKTDSWQSRILAALPKFADELERLGALSELVWRREAQLDPLFEDLEEAVAGALKEVDCSRRLVGCQERPDLDWQRVRCQWRTLAAALVTEARFNFHREKFDFCINQLAPFLEENEDLAERVQHEKCLWALNHLDYAELGDLVGEWQPKAADPAWLLRKAALLVELGRTEEARDLALSALETVRRWSDDRASLAGVSREAWALRLAHATDDDQENSVWKLRDLESRFRELAQYRCDPRTEFRAHELAIEYSHQVGEDRPFDLGPPTGKGLSLSNVARNRALASLRGIRFVEVVGSPSVVSGYLLSGAAEALLPYSPEWTSALTLRSAMGTPDQDFSKTLSRWRVAFITPELARSLAESQRSTIKLALEQLDGLERSADAVQSRELWGHRLGAAMEALSRFVLRLKPEEVESVLELARSLYSDSRIHSNVFYAKPLANLLRRASEALPPSSKAEHALDLLSLPIVGVDGFSVDMENHFKDPGYIIDAANSVRDCPAPPRSEANENAWLEVVHLVNKGLRTGGSARKRAALRLAVLSRWKKLTGKEQQRLAETLWGFGLDNDQLPKETDLHPWVFLQLPEPEPGLTEKRLRATWVRAESWKRENSRLLLEKILGGVGAVLERLPECGNKIELTNAERGSLQGAVERWAEVGFSTISSWDHQKVGPWRQNVRNISTLLLELELSPDAAQKLLVKVRQRGTGRTPAYELLPGIVRSDGGLADAAAALLRVGLGGATPEQREQAASAGGGLYQWLRATSVEDSGLPQPPADLVFEIGVIISAPRWSVLPPALEVAAWVFEEGTAEHRELLRPPVLSGLEFLRRALVFREISTHPFVKQPQVNEDDVDVPWLRWHCVRLATAMDSAGFGDEAVVIGWLKDAETDPLPEVRFAVADWGVGRISENAPDSE